MRCEECHCNGGLHWISSISFGPLAVLPGPRGGGGRGAGDGAYQRFYLACFASYPSPGSGSPSAGKSRRGVASSSYSKIKVGRNWLKDKLKRVKDTLLFAARPGLPPLNRLLPIKEQDALTQVGEVRQATRTCPNPVDWAQREVLGCRLQAAGAAVAPASANNTVQHFIAHQAVTGETFLCLATCLFPPS